MHLLYILPVNKRCISFYLVHPSNRCATVRNVPPPPSPPLVSPHQAPDWSYSSYGKVITWHMQGHWFHFSIRIYLACVPVCAWRQHTTTVSGQYVVGVPEMLPTGFVALVAGLRGSGAKIWFTTISYQCRQCNQGKTGVMAGERAPQVQRESRKGRPWPMGRNYMGIPGK